MPSERRAARARPRPARRRGADRSTGPVGCRDVRGHRLPRPRRPLRAARDGRDAARDDLPRREPRADPRPGAACRRAARASRQDGARKVLARRTSIEEVLRVTAWRPRPGPPTCRRAPTDPSTQEEAPRPGRTHPRELMISVDRARRLRPAPDPRAPAGDARSRAAARPSRDGRRCGRRGHEPPDRRRSSRRAKLEELRGGGTPTSASRTDAAPLPRQRDAASAGADAPGAAPDPDRLLSFEQIGLPESVRAPAPPARAGPRHRARPARARRRRWRR